MFDSIVPFFTFAFESKINMPKKEGILRGYMAMLPLEYLSKV
jgi:hypothetical protein